MTLFDRLLPSKNMLYALRLDDSLIMCAPAPCRARTPTDLWWRWRGNSPSSNSSTSRAPWSATGHPTLCSPSPCPAITSRSDRGQAARWPPAGMPAAPHPHQPATHSRLELGLPLTLDYLTADLGRDTSRICARPSTEPAPGQGVRLPRMGKNRAAIVLKPELRKVVGWRAPGLLDIRLPIHFPRAQLPDILITPATPFPRP